jgi:hypothetical protein
MRGEVSTVRPGMLVLALGFALGLGLGLEFGSAFGFGFDLRGMVEQVAGTENI